MLWDTGANRIRDIKVGRGGQIGTAGLRVPNAARYQTALRPDVKKNYVVNVNLSVPNAARYQAALRPASDIIG